jgi:hypothetical protein
VQTRAFTVHHADGSQTRVMQSTVRPTPRIAVTLRVAVDEPERGTGPVRLSVSELEAVIRAAQDMIGAYDLLAREQAAGRAPAPLESPPPRRETNKP